MQVLCEIRSTGFSASEFHRCHHHRYDLQYQIIAENASTDAIESIKRAKSAISPRTCLNTKSPTELQTGNEARQIR